MPIGSRRAEDAEVGSGNAAGALIGHVGKQLTTPMRTMKRTANVRPMTLPLVMLGFVASIIAESRKRETRTAGSGARSPGSQLSTAGSEKD